MDKNHEIALKAWEIYQGIAKGMGDAAWKIKSIYFALSTALITYSYTSSTPELYILIPILSVLFLLLESGYKRLQIQYIEKCHLIERTLNDFIAGDEYPRFPTTIGTRVNTPTIKQLIELFSPKRVIFWLPYLIIFIVTIIMWISDFSSYKEKNSKHLISKKYNQDTYIFSKSIKITPIYFDKGSIIVDKISAKKDLDNIFMQQFDKNNKYIIKLTGFASTETVQQKNTLSNNYQISLARANNVKKNILDILDKKNIQRENIFIDTFAYSNQDISVDKISKHDINRKVIIEITELKKLKEIYKY